MFGDGRNQWGWNWDPWREFQRIQRDMNRLFGDYTGRPVREYPAVNLWTSQADVVLTAEIPGVERDDLDISVQDNMLNIHGARNPDILEKDETYHRQERGNGSFSRTIQLPFAVDANRAEARMERGILRLTLPRAESDKPKKIEIKTV